MKKGQMFTFLLLFFGTFAIADTYKWIDDSGNVHYGDSPPTTLNSERVFISEGPSKEDIQRQQQQIKALIDKLEQERLLEHANKPTITPQPRAWLPDNVACFSPLSDLVQGPSSQYYAPISPRSIDKQEQASLKHLLASIKTRGTWRGVMFELACWDEFPEQDSPAKTKYRSSEIEMSTDWDKSESLLTLDFEVPYEHNLVYRLAVDDFFYFNEIRASNITVRDDNKVELLNHQQDSAAFLLKRYIPYRHHHHFHFNHHGTRLRADIRYIEVSDRNLKLVELYYYDGMLVSSKTWLLSRINKT